ncbi:hypothetical protein [Alkalilimnicola ehrlichii]|uniref:hypothetical protein n=1 Tax=Alkalilimnicola ehrlichii TaxID=351052 RepID=UPI003BA2617D
MSAKALQLGVPALVAGLLYLAGTAWVGDREHWVPISPYPGEHFMALTTAPDGRLFAGAQSGAVLERDPGGPWRLHNTGLPAITWLLPDGDGLLAGTIRGVYASPDGRQWAPVERGLPEGLWVLQFEPLPDGLRLLSPDQGLYRRDDQGRWHADHSRGLPAGVHIYHYARDTQGGDHVGTVAEGAYYRPDPGADWRPNSEGLHRHARGFSLLRREGGIILGSDRGAWWQSQPGERWQALGTGRHGFRVLDLAEDARSRVWAASDEGIWVADESDRDGRPTPWRSVPMRDEGPQAPVSRFHIDGDQHLAAAGAIYQLERDRGWQVPILVMAILAGVMTWAMMHVPAVTGRRPPPNHP